MQMKFQHLNKFEMSRNKAINQENNINNSNNVKRKKGYTPLPYKLV